MNPTFPAGGELSQGRAVWIAELGKGGGGVREGKGMEVAVAGRWRTAMSPIPGC